MAGTLRDIRELEAEIEAAGLRGITKQQILDSLRSQAKVAGVLSVRDGVTAQTTVAGWNRLDLFDTSRDTQGVAEGLTDPTDPGGWYFVRNAAKGDFTCSLFARVTSDTDGDYDFRITTANDSAVPDTWESAFSPVIDTVALVAGVEGTVNIAASMMKDVQAQERIQVEFRGPNNSQVTVSTAQFGIQR